MNGDIQLNEWTNNNWLKKSTSSIFYTPTVYVETHSLTIQVMNSSLLR